MSRLPMGKMLLRNVIRHTDAHNKIQEESEMWKLRDMERQAQEHSCRRRPQAAHLIRDSMRCERLDGERESSRERFGEREVKEARYWTRRLQEFEATDPERWGHSGFKELYPEEFQSDSGKQCSDGENVHKTRLEKAKLVSDRHKRSKKKKKRRRKRRRADSSGEERSSGEGAAGRHRRNSAKSKHRRKRKIKERKRKADSSLQGSDLDRGAEGRKRVCSEPQASDGVPQRKRRNWKEAKDERSEESSED